MLKINIIHINFLHQTKNDIYNQYDSVFFSFELHLSIKIILLAFFILENIMKIVNQFKIKNWNKSL